ncbi:MAG: type VI secretion system tip protein VgrG [Verrucomicrobia bacterium]|nr:type VI secretion system tip protein VgrG [Verrucomicrobiota bacterium]
MHLQTPGSSPRRSEPGVPTHNGLLCFNAGGFTAGDAGLQTEGHETFACGFSAMPTTQQYRPARAASKPLITGPQTAIVTGPAGEEIHTDKFGRVKVHFHWDRYGKFDADSSCWIRVSQYWAGKNWGAMHIPRMGQEVIVEFLEGDPDKPIITGRVYNGEAKPPYPLPASKNISTLMSNSTKGGGGYNEIKMDDTKSAELLYIQAEKDRTVLVKHDNTETVHHDEIIEIGNDRSKHVLKNEDVTIDENRTEEVKKNEDITIGVDRTEEVKNNEEVKIGKNRTHDVGEKDILTVGKELFVNVGDKITIKTGDSSIIMLKDGTIQIKGKDISIVGSGLINIKASSDVVIKGSKVLSN